MQLLRRRILHVAKCHVRRLPAARLDDRERVKPGDEHVLGGADAAWSGQSVLEHAPRAAAAKEIGALAEEIAARL